jgi:uncharacterized membrane protein
MSTVGIMFGAIILVAVVVAIVALIFRKRAIANRITVTMRTQDGTEAVDRAAEQRASGKPIVTLWQQNLLLWLAIGLLLYIVVVYFVFLKSWAGSFLTGPSILAKMFTFAVVLAYIVVLTSYRDIAKMVKRSVYITIGLVLALLVARAMFPSQFKVREAVKAYQAPQPTGTYLTRAIPLTQAVMDSVVNKNTFGPSTGRSNFRIPEGGAYLVKIPLGVENVTIENVGLEKAGDRLVPLYLTVVNVRLPFPYDTSDVTARGVVKYYQKDGSPYWLSIQEMPEALAWIRSHTSQDRNFGDLFVRNDERTVPFAKNDHSFFCSLQELLNNSWQPVQPPLVMPPVDFAQPIVLGVNLQRGTHANASGCFWLIFQISRTQPIGST